MSSENDLKDLIEKLHLVEGEIKLLQNDKKELFLDFKDKVDIKAFKVAWSFIKRTENLDEDQVNKIVTLIKKVTD